MSQLTTNVSRRQEPSGDPPKTEQRSHGHFAQVRLRGRFLPVRQIFLTRISQQGNRSVIGQILFLKADDFDSLAEQISANTEERQNLIYDKNSKSLIVRVSVESGNDITPSQEEFWRLHARVSRHLAETFGPVKETNGMGVFNNYERAAKLALGPTKRDVTLSIPEVLDYCLREGILTRGIASLNSEELLDQVLENLFEGKLPSGQGALPPHEKERWASFALDLSDGKELQSVEEDPKAKIRLTLPNASPGDQKAWHEQAKAIMAGDSVRQQAERIKVICKSKEFMEELGKKAPVLVPTGTIHRKRHKKPMQLSKEKGYVHFRIWFHQQDSTKQQDGPTITLRWHTKTSNENKEIPNFRVTKEVGLKEYELLYIPKDSILDNSDLKRALGLEPEGPETYWIPRNSYGDWDIKSVRVEGQEVLRYGNGQTIPWWKLRPALIEATHIDYVPAGMDCVTPSNKLGK